MRARAARHTVTSVDLPVAAGLVSTMLFAVANLPMVWKAVRTRDLASYSLGYLLIANAGNVVHTIYIVSLPVGPIWLLHGFYLVTMVVMLALYLRAVRSRPPAEPDPGVSVEHGQGGARRVRAALLRVR